MTETELKNVLYGDMPDKILCYTLAGGQARAYVARTTNIAAEAKKIHGLSSVAAAALGQTLTFAAIMGVQMKSDRDRLSITIKGGGPLGAITAAANSAGEVKGFCDNPGAELMLRPDGRLNVGGAIGNSGRLTIIKDLGLKEPYVGNVELQTGEPGQDFAYYLAVSEQQPSAVALGVLVKNGQVESAGGVVLQPLPGCSEEVLTFLESSVPLITDVSSLFEGNTAEFAAEVLLYPIEHKLEGEFSPRYNCDCGRERLAKVLAGLGRDELLDMIEKQNGAEITCHFCNSVYNFSADELKSLLP